MMSPTSSSNDDDQEPAATEVMIAPELPDHFIESIFLKLPVKSLIRYVSKQWKETISGPSFANLHMKQYATQEATTTAPAFIVLYSIDLDDYSGKSRIDADRIISTHYLCHQLHGPPATPQFRHERFTIPQLESISSIDCWTIHHHSSCNGLVCTTRFEVHKKNGVEGVESMQIWNPATGKYRVVPIPPYAFVNNMDGIIGLGYDGVADDYKIVHISIADPFSSSKRQFAQVMSLRSNRWKSITDHHHPSTFPDLSRFYTPNIPSLSPVVSVGRYVHWIVHNQTECEILRFDVVEERYELLPFSLECENTTKHMLHSSRLACYNDSLFLFIPVITWIFVEDYYDWTLWMLEMKELDKGNIAAWKKVASIPTIDQNLFYSKRRVHFWPLGFNSNGHVTMFKEIMEELFAYILTENKFVKIKYTGHDDCYIEDVHMVQTKVSICGNQLENQLQF